MFWIKREKKFFKLKLLKKAARYFNTSNTPILNCIQTGKLYKNKYKFSYNKLN